MAIDFVFNGCPFPVDNGARSTFVALAKQLSEVCMVRVFLLPELGSMTAANLPVRNEFTERGVKVVSLSCRMDWRLPMVPAPLLSWFQSFAGTDWQSIEVLRAAGLGTGGAQVIFFCSGWNPMAFRLTAGFPGAVLFTADSIALFEQNRIRSGRLARLKSMVAQLIARRVEGVGLRAPIRAAIYVSPKDAAYAKSYGTPARIEVVPIGIDPKEYPVCADDCGQATLLFTGVMEYLPNKDAAEFLVREVMPLLSELPLRLRLVGKGADTALAHLAGERVEVLGWVPSLAEVQLSASLFVCPLRMGAGAKNKVLQSLAAGVPVIGTAEAFSGFDTLPPGCVLCESAQEFADAIVCLLSDRNRRNVVSAAAREFALCRCTWTQSSQKLISVIAAV